MFHESHKMSSPAASCFVRNAQKMHSAHRWHSLLDMHESGPKGHDAIKTNSKIVHPSSLFGLVLSNHPNRPFPRMALWPDTNENWKALTRTPNSSVIVTFLLLALFISINNLFSRTLQASYGAPRGRILCTLQCCRSSRNTAECISQTAFREAGLGEASIIEVNKLPVPVSPLRPFVMLSGSCLLSIFPDFRCFSEGESYLQ